MRILFFGALLIGSLFTAAAQNNLNEMSADQLKQQLNKLDSIASSLFVQGDYEEALVNLLRETNLLERTPEDPHYVEALVKIGRCYEHLELPFKAIEANKRAISLHSKKVSQEDVFIANRSKDIADLYHKMGDDTEAYGWAREAIRIGENAGNTAKNDRVRYYRCASEIAFSLGKVTEAIHFQKELLKVADSYVNPHHDEYLEQLATLRAYYSKIGDTENHTMISEQIRQLKKELEEGLLPEPADLSTPRKCRSHNTEALLCSRWILGNYISSTGMKTAADFIVRFRKNSPDVAVYLGPSELSWAKRNASFHVAYIAASVEYALTHPDEQRYSFEQYKAAIYRLLPYYQENKNIAGEIKRLDKYISLWKSDPKKLDAQLAANFEEFTNAMKSKKGDINVEDPVIVNFAF